MKIKISLGLALRGTMDLADDRGQWQSFLIIPIGHQSVHFRG